MLIFTGKVTDTNFNYWSMVDRIIRVNFTPEMNISWCKNGYDGLISLAPQHFGITRMYRNREGFITFEFTEEQWAWFLLRWS
jgi:hypothetical protein